VLQSSALNGLANKCSLVRTELDFHLLSV
jgi:hypothetical protein